MHVNSRCGGILRKVGEVLNDFCNEGECARGAVIWIFLHEAKEGGRHDGWTQETQK